MAWDNAVVTNAGVAMLQQVLAGETLVIDGAAGGTGTVVPSALMAQTELNEQKQSFSVVGQANVPNGKKLNIAISNCGLDTGYQMQQVGIFAHVSSNPSALFAILQDETGIAIPASTDIPDFAMNFYAVINFSNESDFSFTVDTSALVNVGMMNTALEQITTQIDLHIADYVRNSGYAVTTGENNNYLVSTVPAPLEYVDGMGIVIRVHQANTGEPTINWNGLGAIPIVDGKGNPLIAGKMPLGGRLSLRYSSVSENFQLLGEGGEYGNATPDKVLKPYTIGTDEGIKEGTILSKAADVYNPSQSKQIINAGQYLAGNQVINPVEFDSSKVLNDTTIAGKAGTMPAYYLQDPVVLTQQEQQFYIPRGFHDGSGIVAVGSISGILDTGTWAIGQVGVESGDVVEYTESLYLAYSPTYIVATTGPYDVPIYPEASAISLTTINIDGLSTASATIPLDVYGSSLTLTVDCLNKKLNISIFGGNYEPWMEFYIEQVKWIAFL